MKTRLAVLFALVASACQVPILNSRPREEEDGRIVAIPAPERADVAIGPVAEPTGANIEPLDDDSTLVPSASPGTVRITEEPLREVEGVSTGKVWLLELYQRTLADKEELARKLEASESDRMESHARADALAAERDELAARRAELDGRVRELEAQSLELARRLVESEIARLEAQKSELERAAMNDRKERP